MVKLSKYWDHFNKVEFLCIGSLHLFFFYYKRLDLKDPYTCFNCNKFTHEKLLCLS